MGWGGKIVISEILTLSDRTAIHLVDSSFLQGQGTWVLISVSTLSGFQNKPELRGSGSL